MIACVAGSIFMIMAWLADALLERRSFGILGNMLILIIGAFAGVFLLAQIGAAPTQRHFMHAVLVCSVTAVLLLVISAALRRTY